MLALFACAYQARAASVSLADWCVNVNGNTPATSCNGQAGGSTATGPAASHISLFDTTAEPGSNNLGSVTVTLSASSNPQFVSLFADYDVDYSSYGSFDDFAAVSGAAPAHVTYEIGDPNNSNIFSDFVGGNALPNTNPETKQAQCCDVAFALEDSALVVPTGFTGTLTFKVSTTNPGGFYIEQTNVTLGDNIFLSVSSLSLTATGGGGPTGAPEPSTFSLGLGLMGLAFVLSRRRKVRTVWN